jgi:hypothetical protein
VTADDRPPQPNRRLDRAALAPNWRSVLAADAALGLAVTVVGVVVAVLVSVPVGVVLAVAGAAYVAAGVARWRRWARLRADAGLDGPPQESRG